MTLYPTFCDILDLPEPDWLQGVSLLPLFANSEKEVQEEIYAEIFDIMEKKLHQWMEQTEDPLLKNDNQIPIPRGGLVNKRDSIEPIEGDFI